MAKHRRSEKEDQRVTDCTYTMLQVTILIQCFSFIIRHQGRNDGWCIGIIIYPQYQANWPSV